MLNLANLQTIVDEDPAPGRFLLTGSQNFALIDSVSQALARRTALLELLLFRLPPFHSNFGKRLIKTHKLYFSAFSKFAARLAERGDQRWRLARQLVVYGGESSQSRSAGELIAWQDLPQQ